MLIKIVMFFNLAEDAYRMYRKVAKDSQGVAQENSDYMYSAAICRSRLFRHEKLA